jgi:glycosyltransferase involved in cell wall biosynthesis
MHVAFVHDAIIPPPKYGGTERVIDWLVRALHRLGHRTTLLAAEGSSVPGSRVLALRRGVPIDEQLPADVDVIHLWGTPDPVPRSKPFLVTIEGNGRPGERFHPNTVFISKRHALNHGGSRYVFNGLDPEGFDCPDERDDYLVFLAKASWPVKNLEGAIAVARAAGARLEVLGSRDWPAGLHRLLPRVRGVRYHGMVGDAEKRQVLRRARALLFPVRWHEPFGIALTEALASGCPVLGTPYGSLPEIVTPDVGVLSADGQKLVEALRGPWPFTARKCRERVLSGGLTHLAMAEAYVGYYERLMRTGSIAEPGEPAPATVGGGEGLSAKSLLPWTQPS